MSVSSAASALASFVQSTTPTTGPAKPKAGHATPVSASSADLQSVQAWVQKNQIEKLQAEFRDKVMHKRNLTDDALQQMGSSDRARVENSIQQEAAQDMHSALQSRENSSAGQKTPGGQVLDIKV